MHSIFQGAQEMFRNLPHEYVTVEHLSKVSQHGSKLEDKTNIHNTIAEFNLI